MRIACLISVVLLALAGPAPAQQSPLWERFDIFANLDNEGNVVVTETLVARVNGDMAILDRQFAVGPDQEIVIRKIVRVDGVEQRPVADVNYHNEELTWRIRAADDPMWRDETLTFHLEYELRGAILPAWDIPAGPGTFRWGTKFPHFRERWGETFAAWRAPRDRYRFDHDVMFARFESDGPRELKYTFKYDTNWKHPQPSTELNVRVKPGSNYRVTELRDFLSFGTPAAVALWKPMVRVGSIFAFAAAALGLWGIFAIGQVLQRGLLAPRLGREWFREKFAAIPPEILARQAQTIHKVSVFPLVLARWRKSGVVDVQEGPEVDKDGDAILRLRLLDEGAATAPHERALLRQLFPKGRETTVETLSAAHAEEGFDPETALEDAIDDAQEKTEETQAVGPEQPSWFWSLLRRCIWPMFIAAGVLILVDSFLSEYNDSLSLIGYFIGGFFVVCLLASILPKSLGGLGRALVALVPVLAAMPGVMALHFYHTLPLRAEGSAGLALLAFAAVTTWLMFRRLDFTAPTSEGRAAEMGRIYVHRELRRAHPQLDDAWIPQIVALGGESALEKWRARRTAAPGAPVLPGALPSLDNLRPFTGHFSLEKEEEWADQLSVLSAEERRENEDEDEEDEDKDKEDNQPGPPPK